MVVALAGGTWIFMAVIIVFGLAVVYGIYTRRGSGVDEHPYRHVYGGAPGAAVPSEGAGGSDRTATREREVVKKWRETDREPHPPAEERAAQREKEQRPEPGNKPSIGPPL